MKYRLNIIRIKRGINAGQFRWNITATANEIVAHGESYKRLGSLLTMLGRVFKGAALEAQTNAYKSGEKVPS